MNWRYHLSKVIPVPMHSNYKQQTQADPDAWAPRRSTWWQWRNRIYRHRVTRLA